MYRSSIVHLAKTTQQAIHGATTSSGEFQLVNVITLNNSGHVFILIKLTEF